MYDTQIIAERIKERAKVSNFSMKEMFSDLGLGINTVSHLAKGQEISYLKIAKIADYLECSVDYLLGRTDTPQVSQNNVIHTGDITGNHNANINSKDNSDTQELLELIKSLPLVKRAEAIILINDLKKKENG